MQASTVEQRHPPHPLSDPLAPVVPSLMTLQVSNGDGLMPDDDPLKTTKVPLQEDPNIAAPRPVSWDDIVLQDNKEDNHQQQSEEEDFCSSEVSMQEFPVFINQDLTIQILQAPTAFRGVEHDETGKVLWGASVCLARYITTLNLDRTTILELGCGIGLPSLVAAKSFQGSRVLATDMEEGTLQQLDQVASLNDCQDKLGLYKMNWNDKVKKMNHDHDMTSSNKDQPRDTHTQTPIAEMFHADVILASDVIYSRSMVEPLVQTIQRFLEEDGTAYIAMRNTRQGVAHFWRDAMPNAGFVLVETISCHPLLDPNYTGHPETSAPDSGGDTSKARTTYSNDNLQLPPGFRQESQSHRWRGDHTIYVFQKQRA